MLEELQARINQAYANNEMDYFHGKQFIQDLAALGMSLSDLPSDIVVVKDDNGKYDIKPIWPDLAAKMMLKIALTCK